MSASLINQQKLFGLFELDTAGTVLYSRIEPEGSSSRTGPNIAGTNFFEQVAPFCNAEELRQRIREFTRSQSPADNFNFVCQYDNGPQPVRVLLARIRERSSGEQAKSMLVHIRKA